MSNGVFSPWGRYNPDLGACGCNLIYPTTLMFSRCVYTNTTMRAQFNQGYPDYFNGFMADIITARYVIFAFGFLLAVFLSFVYSHVLRFERLSLVLVWGSIATSFSSTCIYHPYPLLRYQHATPQSFTHSLPHSLTL